MLRTARPVRPITTLARVTATELHGPSASGDADPPTTGGDTIGPAGPGGVRTGPVGAADTEEIGSPAAPPERGSPGPGTDEHPLRSSAPPRPLASMIARAAAPALVFLALRGLGLAVLAWLAGRHRTTVAHALAVWDGQWFLDLARYGYDGVPAGMVDAFGRRTAETPLAFFPGYPAVVAWVAGVPGVSVLTAALVVSVGCGVICAYGLARLTGWIARAAGWPSGRAAGLIMVGLFAVMPMSIVLTMAYTESMFCALAVWALVAVCERRWVLAGLACAAAGLVRPTAIALVGAVLLAAGVAVLRRRDGWRPWAGGLLAPAGLVGYVLWVGGRTGAWDGWFTLQQRGWDSQFDYGRATVTFGLEMLADARSVLEVATVAFLGVAVVLVFLGWWPVRRLVHRAGGGAAAGPDATIGPGRVARVPIPWPVLVYSTVALVTDLGSNGLMNSKARLLVPAFTLLLPVAFGLARRRPGTVVAALAGLGLASAWFGAYALTAWPYAI